MLIASYPLKWRARYGDEFAAMLEKQPTTLGDVFNIVGCASNERWRSLGDNLMRQVNSSLALILFAGVATLAAGANLYFTVDDTPLAATIQAHRSLSACWLAVAAGSLLAGVGLAIASVPVLWTMARFAWVGRRTDIGLRLAFAAGALVAVLLWIVGVVVWAHWAPLPWAVTGDWLAPTNWPPVKVRWKLWWVTLALLACAVIGSAMSLRQAMAMIKSSPQTPGLSALSWPSLHRMRTFALAICIVTICTMAGAAVGGVLADSYSPALFQARSGFLASSVLVSWLASVGLLGAAAAAAVGSLQCAGSSRREPVH
jgi:hypothetical protein